MTQARCTLCDSIGHSVIDCQAVDQIIANEENGMIDAQDMPTIVKNAIQLAKDQRQELIQVKPERNRAKGQANYIALHGVIMNNVLCS